jgi:hypothetical protein
MDQPFSDAQGLLLLLPYRELVDSIYKHPSICLHALQDELAARKTEA